MSGLKKLLSNTMIYGLSTIVGRSINFLLIIPHTDNLSQADYGILSGLFAYVAFLNVVYVFGMETTYFRNANEQDEKKAFNGTFTIVLTISALLSVLIFGFTEPFAEFINYPDKTELIKALGIIMLIDALAALPFARLRQHNQAINFAVIRLINIGLVVLLNLFFLTYLPSHATDNVLFNSIYIPNHNLEYVIWSTLTANSVFVPLIIKNLKGFKPELNLKVLKSLLSFSFPLVIAGLSGMINELFDRRLLKTLTPDNFYDKAENNDVVVGIYSASYKLTMFITLANQAFRYAAEPFFFSKAKEKNAPTTFVTVMKYYVIFMCIAVVGISLLRNELGEIFIKNETLRSGLYIVPILLMANVFLGIYYNQSIWYKITNKTNYGLIISTIGAAVTISLNYILIPQIGFLGSAIATLICYFAMVLCSHYWGQKFYPVPYKTANVILHLGLALGIIIPTYYFEVDGLLLNLIIKITTFFLYLAVVFLIEQKPFKNLKKNEYQHS